MSEILHYITIQAPPEQVFEAITTQEGLQGWWTDDTVAEPRVGSVAEFGFYNRAVVFRMKVEALEPAKRVRWNCIGGPEEWIGTEITFALAPAEGGGTGLHFDHAGWRYAEGEYRGCNTTWGHLMFYLKQYAESEAPGPFFKSP